MVHVTHVPKHHRCRVILFLILLGSSIIPWTCYQFSSLQASQRWSVQVPTESRIVLEYPLSNIQLLGHFNYDTPTPRVRKWIQIWSKYFAKISVAGPFSKSHFQQLQTSGVDVILGKSDQGFVSPVENLVQALLRLLVPPNNNNNVDAILYVHDDGLLNLTKFAQGHHGHIPTHQFIGNLRHSPERTYSITIPLRHDQDKPPIFQIHGHPKTPTTNTTILLRALPPWNRHEQCLKQRLDMLYHHHSTELQPFGRVTDNGNGIKFLFPAFTQTDFLLVPTLYANTFVRIAKIHVDHGVFLECAFPTIVLWTLLHHHYDQQEEGFSLLSSSWHSTAILQDKTTLVKVCTSWNNKIRGSPIMLENCVQDPDGYGMYHPVKLSRFQATNFSKWLDLVQQPTPIQPTALFHKND